VLAIDRQKVSISDMTMRGVEQGSTGGGSRDVTGPGRGASRTWAGWPAGQTSSQAADTSNSSRRNACIARHDHACSRRREYMHVPMACPGSHEPTSLTVSTQAARKHSLPPPPPRAATTTAGMARRVRRIRPRVARDLALCNAMPAVVLARRAECIDLHVGLAC
jgi:hypothetical protein